jgi:hypothetical protein
MNVIERVTGLLKLQVDQNGVVILGQEGAAALLRALEILCAIYENANALGHPYITGWEISTVDYQLLEDFLYPEAEAEASK